MLYLIGLGLADEKDITVKGLEVVKRAQRVYLEAYTAVLLVDKEHLEAYYGRPVILADREMVESSSDEILKDADKVDVALLVVGDPFSATTHTDLLLRARTLKIPTSTIPNASILTAVGATGLQLYNFGQTVSLPFFGPGWRPTSFYDRLAENAALGLHSLVLLDIRVRELDLDAMVRGRGAFGTSFGAGDEDESGVEVRVRTKGPVYEPPRFMSVAVAAAQMLEVEAERQAEAEAETQAQHPSGSSADPTTSQNTTQDPGPEQQQPSQHTNAKPRAKGICRPQALAVGVARVGSADQRIVAGTLAQLRDADLGPPLHSLVLLGSRTHELEREFLAEYAVDREEFERIWRAEYGS